MSDWQASARRTIDIESAALDDLNARVGPPFDAACELLYHCEGRVVITGMGKSGHIGKKIAATLASTGTAAFFVHPGEASHGDLGMIRRGDVVIAISYSGEAQEILAITPALAQRNIPLISLCGQSQSKLAQLAAVNLSVAVEKEACPLGLAPTASTTATLVLGDALAVALLEKRGFTKDDFALSHPAGQLGKRLLLKVCDLMQDAPTASADTAVDQALLTMSEGRLGCLFIAENSKLIGVLTDGDLRRHFVSGTDFATASLDQLATPEPLSIGPERMAAEALSMMQSNAITVLAVVDEDQQILGALSMHELLRAGL